MDCFSTTDCQVMALGSSGTQVTQQLCNLPNAVHKEQVLDVCDRTKTRHPRWTRQETFVLIEGKKTVENQFQGSRRSTSALGSDQIEPKWDSVSSYCKQHGVTRTPVQCRKRWGNMLCDFKKIKTWESRTKDGAESFWLMRNESRRDRKLPSFFDREVYDVLDGRAVATEAIPLTVIAVRTEQDNTDRDEMTSAEEEGEEGQEEAEAVFDRSQSAIAKDGAFSDCEQSGQQKVGWRFKNETNATENPRKTQSNPFSISSVPTGATKEQNLGANPWTGSMHRGGWKRRRVSSDESEGIDLGEKLIKVLGRNMNMLNSQLQTQNINCELDRVQRTDHNNSVVTAINKLTDAIVRISEKLEANG